MSFPWKAAPAVFSLARRRLLEAGGGLLLGSFARASGARAAGEAGCPPVWTSYFKDKYVWAYVDRHSIVPGQAFDLMLSSAPGGGRATGRVEFFRIGSEAETEQKPVWSSAVLTVEQQPVSRSAAATGANWAPTVRDLPTAGWRPGVYSADFVLEGSGIRDLQIVQLVVRNPSPEAGVLLKLGTDTYQAYNEWGGHSLYPTEDELARGTMVSFDRPCGPAFFEFDVFLVRFLERLARARGFALDYAGDFDVHASAPMLKPYDLVISSAHDEYWTKELFDAFEARIHGAGRNTIFFGANAAYWQARYADVNRPPGGDDRGRQLICAKSGRDPIVRRAGKDDAALLATTRFRENARRPESMLFGIAYQNWFPSDEAQRYPYTVTSTDLPFFEGTGWRVGDAAADVVGYEWDNRDPAGDGRRLWDVHASRISPIPADQIKVLFRGSPRANDGTQGLAEAIFFRSKAGAKVFAAGSTRWAWGLGKPGFANVPFQRFNENLVLNFLEK